MIVVFELIALAGLIWGLILAGSWLTKNQKIYHPAKASHSYVKGLKCYTGKSVWHLPFTAPVFEANHSSNSICIDGDVLTQYGVCAVAFVLHARITSPVLASTYVDTPVFDSYDVFQQSYQKIKSVLQVVLNEAGSQSMAYTPELHATAHAKFKEFCERHGLELEDIRFETLELKSATSVEVQVQAQVFDQFNSGSGKNTLQL